MQSMVVVASCCGGVWLERGVQEIDGTTRTEDYLEILKQCLKISGRKLKPGHKLILKQDNDPKHTSKGAPKWLTDNKVTVLEQLLSQALICIPLKICELN